VNIGHSSDSVHPAWAPHGLDPKRKLESLLVAEQYSHPHIQENAARIQTRERVIKTLGFVKDFIDASKRAEAEQRKRQFAKYQRQRARAQAQVKEAQKTLVMPDASTCERYKDKVEFEDFEELNIAGVKIDMDVYSAHEAILCNGYQVNPAVIAGMGGLPKFLTRQRIVKYQKKGADGIQMTVELETRPNRKHPRRAYRVISVRIKHALGRQPSEEQWRRIKKAFKDKYDLSNDREQDYRIQFSDRDIGQSLTLEAQVYRKGEFSTYNISLCCGR